MVESTATLSLAAARRIAIAAQGLAEPRPKGKVDKRHGRKVFDNVGLIQIDSVNVLVRSQELPLFARLGEHNRDLLWSMSANEELFEFRGHEASLIPVAHHHLYRWKLDRGRNGEGWQSVVNMRNQHPGYVEAVLAEIAARGPLLVGELSDPGAKKGGSWWDWSKGKLAVEYLFWTGQITARRRRNNFEREYGLPEEFIPAEVLATPTPTENDARKELLMLAARHHGVGTLRDLADYHRQKLPPCRPLIGELVEDGRLVPVQVQGWNELAYLHPEARQPRRVNARALLSPFDSLVWERSRVERLFDFHYRIEIYVPPPKRVHGYYVLPFLLGDQLVGRVDLKADRHTGRLLAQAAYVEPGNEPGAVAEAMASELQAMATWLGLESIAATGRGSLGKPLKVAVG